ncbi:MAG TPA: low affinity iron permease family protein [Thermomicrobiales bacterium]|nr:low affinity iron permease family protein [Thermomicrobiales bacterium]
MSRWFSRFATRSSAFTGHWATFVVALLLVVLWAATGPFFHFSDTWQLMINTATTISTGLMVFLIQNTQNRDAAAIHLKLDELIRATEGADDALITAEDETQQELAALKKEYAAICDEHARLKAELEHHRRQAA